MRTPEASIRAAIERYAAAWTSGDLAAITACYHADFTLHYFGRNALAGDHVGKAAALKTLGEFTVRTQRRLKTIITAMAGPERGAILARETIGPEGIEIDRLLVYTIKDDLLAECWVYDADQRFIDSLIDPAREKPE
jgi:hypothetical protein